MDSSPESDQQGAIEATGCAELNDQVLLCYDQHRDWRKCRLEMGAFRECYRRFAGKGPKELMSMEASGASQGPLL